MLDEPSVWWNWKRKRMGLTARLNCVFQATVRQGEQSVNNRLMGFIWEVLTNFGYTAQAAVVCLRAHRGERRAPFFVAILT